MSLDDSQEQDCTVYIEQLKSDNPSLKLNAASKIPVIGAVLGYNRIRDELIPYLIEIIEQMDNDNDFLNKMSEGLLQLRKFAQKAPQLAALITPLKILASLDQPPVRDKAVQCLKKLAEGQNRQFYDKFYYPLITNLCQKGAQYAPKIAGCCLIPNTYPHLAEDKQIELRKIFKSLALEEGSPLLRRAVAQNIDDFAKVADKKVIRSDFYDIWNSLIADTFDIIKIKALECSATIARAFKKEEITEKLFKQIRLVDSGKKSWRVRYSLVECLVAISPYLEKDLIRKDVVEAFEQLLKDQQSEVRAISLIKLPEITSKLSTQQAWNVFFQYIQKASKDGNKEAVPTVKLALVEAVIPFFKTVDKTNLIEAGLPILAGLLKDQNQTIRTGIMQRIMQLSEVVGPQGTAKNLLPLIETCLADKKWRFKLAISHNIPNFFKTLPYEQHKDFLQKAINSFLKDHNFAVRQQTYKSLIACAPILGSERYLQLASKVLSQLAGDSNYIYRVTACLFLRDLEGLDKTQLGEMVSTVTKKLENEKVPNVLVALFSTYAQIKGRLSPQSRKEFQSFIGKVKEDKQDEDVLYYATRAQE